MLSPIQWHTFPPAEAWPCAKQDSFLLLRKCRVRGPLAEGQCVLTRIIREDTNHPPSGPFDMLAAPSWSRGFDSAPAEGGFAQGNLEQAARTACRNPRRSLWPRLRAHYSRGSKLRE